MSGDDKTGNNGPRELRDDIDLAFASSTCDSLILADHTDLQGKKEVQEYLYIKGEISSLPNCQVSASGLSLHEFSLITLYNLRLLKVWRTLVSSAQSPERPNVPGSVISSRSQLLCLIQLYENVALINTAAVLQPTSILDISAVLSELKSGLVQCLRSLDSEQITEMINFVVDSSEPTSPTVSLGLYIGLNWLIESETETHKVSTLHELKHRIQLHFLSRCLPSEDVCSEVGDMLALPSLSGHNVCEAFTLALTVILSQEHISLHQLADCVSGFLSLASEQCVLVEEVKLPLFQQLHATIKQLKDRDIHLLSGSDSSTFPENLHFNKCVANALKLLAVPCNEPYWEFSLCTLVEWIQFLTETGLSLTSDVGTKALAVSVCNLSSFAAQTFASSPVLSDTLEFESNLCSTGVTEKAQTEWVEFFSDGLFSPLLPMFVDLASSTPMLVDPMWSSVLDPLACAAGLCPTSHVLSHHLQAKLTVTDNSALPDGMKTLLNHLCPLLTVRHRGVEVAAHNLLASVVPQIPNYETVQEVDNEEEEEIRSPPEALIQVAECGGQFLDSLLVAQVDEHIEMDLCTEEHAQALGYLLAWRLLLQLFRDSPNQLRAKYAQYFKSHDSVNHLLDHLFRLLPLSPSPGMLEFPKQLDASAAKSHEEELPQLALMIYRQCLETLPALVRLWWVDQDRKSSNFIDKFTTHYLSTGLILQQITASQSTENDMEGITIRARPAVREVCATYVMAEVTVNMSITLPENFPLGKLDVACDKRVGVSQAQWDRWLLQLNIFLHHQNGSIVEGLRLWKGNIDKKFEGIEDCMICFSVIHGTTFQLPRLTCKTCRKKYHSACLYKWFSTSQKSSCPLCRNMF